MVSFRNFHTAFGVMAMIALLMVATAAVSPAQAGSASQWKSDPYFATRLIADRTTWQDKKNTLVAGIHVKLAKNFKTYWRYPGDSGLPPRFDWSGSKNLKEARILWPAPTRYIDSAGLSIGYKNEVIFPVVIEPLQAGQPVDLRLKMEIAVCYDICIPGEADLQLTVGNSGFFSRSYVSLLSRYLKRVPEMQAPGSRAGLSVARTQSQLTGAAPHLTVDARFPGSTRGADLFIVGPEGFYLAPAEPVGEPGDGIVRFKVDLTKGDDPKELKGKTVTLTLVSKTAQAETTWRIE